MVETKNVIIRTGLGYKGRTQTPSGAGHTPRYSNIVAEIGGKKTAFRYVRRRGGEERGCWCSIYFSEGKIVEVIDELKLEGDYSGDYTKGAGSVTAFEGSNQFYYDQIFKSTPLLENNYNGKRYRVKVCRRNIEMHLICVAVDYGKYSVGDNVILLCTGDSVSEERVYPKTPVFSDIRCSGKISKCFACGAVIRPLEVEGVTNDIDGTYVITSLSTLKKGVPLETEVGVTTYKYLQEQELEKECIEFAKLRQVGGANQYLYGTYGILFLSIDFANKTLQLERADYSIIAAGIHLNCQSPLSYKDRFNTVIYFFLSSSFRATVLKNKEEYNLINYWKTATVRCPDEVIQLYFFKYTNSTGYTENLRKFYSLTNGKELETAHSIPEGYSTIEFFDIPGFCVTNNYKPVLIAKKLITETVGDVIDNSTTTPIMDGGVKVGYTIDADSSSTQKIVSATCYKIEEKELIPVTTEVVNYEYVSTTSADAIVYYNKTASVAQTANITKRPVAYTIPEYLVSFNTPEYFKFNNLPLSFEDYDYDYDYNEKTLGVDQYTIKANGQDLTVYKEGSLEETTTINYYDAFETLLFTCVNSQTGISYLSTDIVELYPGTYSYINNVIFRKSICTGLYNADFKIRIYDIYVTKTYILNKTINPDYWGDEEPLAVYIETPSNVSYECFIIRYSKEAPFDLSTFKITDCDVATSGEEIDWMKETILAWVLENNPGAAHYLQIFNAFAVPNS